MKLYQMMIIGLLVSLSCSAVFAGTYVVPNDRPETVTTEVLQAGRYYTLRAEGVISDWGDKTDGVDAVWCYAPWRCGPNGEAWQQLRINDKGMADIVDHEIPYNPSHVYEIQILGEGQPLNLCTWDAVVLGSYSNNCGEFTVTITPTSFVRGPATQPPDQPTDTFQGQTLQEAMFWLEANHPYQDDHSHWFEAVRSPDFRRYYQNLLHNDPDKACQLRDWSCRQFEYFPGETMRRLPNSATSKFYCHDYAWRDAYQRDRPVNQTSHPFQNGPGEHVYQEKVNEIIANPTAHGYRRVLYYSALKPGDKVVYCNDSMGSASHSAVVKHVDRSGPVVSGNDVTLVSKEGSNSLFEHKLGTPVSSGNFFRSRFGGAGVLLYTKLNN